ncbi:MAG: hypothetical protein AB8B97_16605 [Granulosicoccus sp.]
MNISKLLPFALIALSSSVYAIDHSGELPAPHMEIKDASGNVVCFAYDTIASAAPIATDCPEGTYTEQLFDSSWQQFSQRSVVIGATAPLPSGLRPTRVESTCVWDETRIRDLAPLDPGFNSNPFCSVTCPSGVAIDGEASATIPGLSNSDDEILDRLSFTEGTGTSTISIFMETGLAADVIFDNFRINGEISEFGDLTYVIEAVAVCL